MIDVGRAHRLPSSAARAALRVRSGGCDWPGCDRPVAFTSAHHLIHWGHGGGTDMTTWFCFCHRHHWLVHEGGWQLARVEQGDCWRFRHRKGIGPGSARRRPPAAGSRPRPDSCSMCTPPRKLAHAHPGDGVRICRRFHPRPARSHPRLPASAQCRPDPLDSRTVQVLRDSGVNGLKEERRDRARRHQYAAFQSAGRPNLIRAG